jgi:hypothetical protein
VECFDDASNFQVRFVLDGDGDSETGEGWYLDDVRIHPYGWGLLSDYGVAEAGSPHDEHYVFMGGTSMATPLTAGAAAVVRQFYTDEEGIDPSAALIKATLINGATDLTPGQYGVGSTGSPIFSDDVEGGTGDWTADAPWAPITSTFHSADHCWTDSPGGNYSSNTDASLTMAGSLDLTAISDPGLVFWHQYDIEYGFDRGYVEISSNDGISWTQELAVTGTMTEWVRSVVDLSPYASETAVKVRFRLDTDSSVSKDGWYIDDVSIEPVSFQEVATRPDTVQGWGRVNLGYSLFPAEPRRRIYRDVSPGLSTGEHDTVEFDVTGASEPLRVTLVWTDYPSSVPAATNLVNNLDLKLTGPDSTVYYPNGLNAPDTLNNVEGIDATSAPPGAYTVEIGGTEVVEGPQPYALIISGGVSPAWRVDSVEKLVTPEGQVNYGDELTYTVVISAEAGTEARFYDPLVDTTFARFVERPPGVIHSDGVITGTLTVTPTNQVTVSLAAQVGVPVAPGTTVTAANSACVYPVDGALDGCVWSNEVTNSAFRPWSIDSIEKLVTPDGQVNYGDELTYTVVISAVAGTPVALYDPLTDTTFARFVEQPPGVVHREGVITGTLTVPPTNQATVSFVAQLDVPVAAGTTVTVANRACAHPVDGTLDECVWSDEVTNLAFRPWFIDSIEKLVAPEGQVNYGDELTYTVVISAVTGTPIGLYDPLVDTTFARFVERPPGVIHSDGAITGTLTVPPTNQATVSFIAQADVPVTVGTTVTVANSACAHPVDGALEECVWSNEVTNSAFRPWSIDSIEKLLTPDGQVNYGDELTYTVVISAVAGTPVALYDPLTDTTFARFVEQPPGVVHREGVITGTLTVPPTNQATVSFVAQLDVPVTAGTTVTAANRACAHPVDGTLDECVWSNEVTSLAFRPHGIYLPLTLRNH